MGVRCGGECISQNIVSVTYFPAKVIIQTQRESCTSEVFCETRARSGICLIWQIVAHTFDIFPLCLVLSIGSVFYMKRFPEVLNPCDC